MFTVSLEPTLPLPPLLMILVAPCLLQKVSPAEKVRVQTQECPICFYNPIESKITSTLPSSAPLAYVPASLLPRLPITAVHLKNLLPKRPLRSRPFRDFPAFRYYTAQLPRTSSTLFEMLFTPMTGRDSWLATCFSEICGFTGISCYYRDSRAKS